MSELCMIVGCGPRMGRHIARAFAGEGFSLALLARREETMAPIAAEAQDVGAPEVVSVTADVTERDSLAGAINGVMERSGVPDVLIYNVATMVKTPPSELTAQEVIDTLPAMFFGALYATEAVLPAMRRRGSGTLLYTGGGFGILPATFTASHSVGKAALRNWVHNLHQELTPEGINVATVTITRPVTDGGTYDGATIARHYLDLHRQTGTTPENRQWEVIHKEL